MSFSPPEVILVPQGAEYQAVRRAISVCFPVRIVPIPISAQPLTHYLQSWLSQSSSYPPSVLVLGLGGSLSPDFSLGDIVIYHECCTGFEPPCLSCLACDPGLTQSMINHLNYQQKPIRAFTSDRIIDRAQEKQSLGKAYHASVVDMEGFTILSLLSPMGVAVAMVRVISDTCDRDIPNLNPAIDAQGNLQPLPLALKMSRHPLRAFRLIRGSLQALTILSKTVSQIYGDR